MLRAAADPTPLLPDEVPFAPAVPPAVMRVFAEVIPPPSDDPVDPMVLRDDDFCRRVASAAGRDAAAAEAARLLLVDLVSLGWIPWRESGEIKLRPPAIRPSPGERPEDFKRRQQREVLQPIRLRQLSEPSVRAFFRRMETPRWVRGRRVSVLDLVDDGRSLAQALAEVSQIPPSERGEALARVVRPVIEMATAEPQDLCPHTGLVRLDIWRYFRHTWSLEYRSTPGRTLFFLIRNAARPMAPIMGIAPLANATLQLKIRDNWVGWSASEMVRSLREEPREILAAMLRTVRHASGEIRKTDLMNLTSRARGELLEQKLEQIASDALERRKDALEDYRRRKERGEEVRPLKNLPRFGNGEVNWRAASEDPLFVAKRARALADLSYAERILSEYEAAEQDLVDVLGREGEPAATRALRALSIAAREIRKVGLASRMLELNVCGAVPPYRDLLVGKLVALAAASADVATMYASRYEDQHSEIASQMAGKAVYRDPSPCVITTTSLYAAVSSQYNRLKLRLDGGRVIHWQELEHLRTSSEATDNEEPSEKRPSEHSKKTPPESNNWTAGKGTGHLSDETVQALRALTIKRDGLRKVNNVFGEGQSPRLRQVRDGLSELRLDPDHFLCHSMPRRVYGLELFPDARRTLCLNLPATSPRIPFDEIAAAWRSRWLEPRIANRDVLVRVTEAGPETVQAELAAPETGPQKSLFPVVESRGAAAPSSTRQAPERIIIMAKKSNPNFVQNLYRAFNACADHHTEDEIAQVHIETAVESFIRDRARDRVVLVTGNPGDGKTHLLRQLADVLDKKVEVCLDANEMDDGELAPKIDGAFRRKRGGLVVAINEGILAQLVRSADASPWAKAAREQMLYPFVYRKDEPPVDDRLLVVDLNLRNNLAPDIVRKALERLVRLGAPCAGCPRQGCEFVENVRRVSDGGVDAVVALLGAVARAGVHAPMRDLFGFLAFLLAGPRTCRVIQSAPDTSERMYWNNAFIGGKGPLFDAVRRFEPHLQTSPIIDDQLWRAADRPEDWHIQGGGRAYSSLEPLLEQVDIFKDRKRRALFEHRRGLSLLGHSGSAIDREMQELLRPGQSTVRKVVRLINRFFDRDDEEKDMLRLWVTHRYDAGAPRYAASAASTPASELELLVPRLHSNIAAAFPDYAPDHVVLCERQGGSPYEGLRIDRTLIEALLEADHGLPTSFQRGEPGVRIASFLDKLSKRYGDLADEREIDVHIVDRDTGNNMRIEVDVEGRRYIRASSR